MCSPRSTLPAPFYVVRRVPQLFFSHSTPSTWFLDALRHQRDGNHEKITSLLKEDHALRSASATPGPAYFFPYFLEMKSALVIQKMKSGPVGLLTVLSRASFRQKMLFILPMPLDSISKWQSTRPWQMSPMPDKAGAEHQLKGVRARTRQRCLILKPRE